MSFLCNRQSILFIHSVEASFESSAVTIQYTKIIQYGVCTKVDIDPFLGPVFVDQFQIPWAASYISFILSIISFTT